MCHSLVLPLEETLRKQETMPETIKTGSPVRSLITMKEWGWKQGDMGGYWKIL